MNHDTARERLALKLYGELDAHEAGDLDAHLTACARCRAFAAELDAGLGRLVVAKRMPDEMPLDWKSRLRRRTSGSPAASLGGTWWAAAAGFLLGAATIALVTRATPAKRVDPEVAQHGSAASDPGPAPRSTAGPGPLARLGEYLAH